MTQRRVDFDEFVSAHALTLLRRACLLTGNRTAAEDLLQEVLERLYVAWPRVDDPLAYTSTALTRRAATRWRLRARRPEVELRDHHDVGIGDGAAGRAELDRLLVALAQLSPRQRAVVVLRYLEDRSERDTADALGVSVGTVKSQASRGLHRLRGLLSDSVEELAMKGQS
ncbi:MAG: SigE family RNA polymerase sigma factor [Nocardioidaceae bacterium]